MSSSSPKDLIRQYVAAREPDQKRVIADQLYKLTGYPLLSTVGVEVAYCKSQQHLLKMSYHTKEDTALMQKLTNCYIKYNAKTQLYEYYEIKRGPQCIPIAPSEYKRRYYIACEILRTWRGNHSGSSSSSSSSSDDDSDADETEFKDAP